MFKKTVNYENFEGREVAEDLYFHLSKIELLELNNMFDENFTEKVENLVKKRDVVNLVGLMKTVISKGYGRRSEDGSRFVKNQEITEEFMSSEACSELLLDLILNVDSATAFFKNLVPPALLKKLNDINSTTKSVEDLSNKQDPNNLTEDELRERLLQTQDERPAWVKENREPTRSELAKMTKEQMLEVFRRKNESKSKN